MHQYLTRKRSPSTEANARNMNDIVDTAINCNISNNCICELCHHPLKNQMKMFLTRKEAPHGLDITCFKCFFSSYQNMNYHSIYSHYSIVDKMDFPWFSKNWSFIEEWGLLKRIEKDGFDNWEDISGGIRSKTKYECEAHFALIYIRNDFSNWYLPSFGETQWKVNTEAEAAKVEELKNEEKYFPGTTATGSQMESEKMNKYDDSISSSKDHNSSSSNQMQVSSTVEGFWPFREEFEIEYHNDAENEIANWEFLETDTQEEREIKFKMLEIYNSEWDERQIRKHFVIDHGWIDVKSYFNNQGKLSEEDQEIFRRIKPFARSMNKSEFIALFEGWVIEKNLKQRIEQLKRSHQEIGEINNKKEAKICNTKNNKTACVKGSDSSKINAVINNSCGVGNEIKNWICDTVVEGGGGNRYEKETRFIKKLGWSKSEYAEVKTDIMRNIILQLKDNMKRESKWNGNGNGNGKWCSTREKTRTRMKKTYLDKVINGTFTINLDEKDGKVRSEDI